MSGDHFTTTNCLKTLNEFDILLLNHDSIRELKHQLEKKLKELKMKLEM